MLFAYNKIYNKGNGNKFRYLIIIKKNHSLANIKINILSENK